MVEAVSKADAMRPLISVVSSIKLAGVSARPFCRFSARRWRSTNKMTAVSIRSPRPIAPPNRHAYAHPPKFPGHGVIGEEYGAERTTRNMSGCSIRSTAQNPSSPGMVAWGTLIGLMRFGEPVLHDEPAVHAREIFRRRRAARYRGPAGDRALHVRACASLGRRQSVHHQPAMNKSDRAAFGRLENAVKLSRYGGDCHALHAGGRLIRSRDRDRDKPTTLSGDPDRHRRRGIVTTWDKRPGAGCGRVIVAGDPRVHQAAWRCSARDPKVGTGFSDKITRSKLTLIARRARNDASNAARTGRR